MRKITDQKTHEFCRLGCLIHRNRKKLGIQEIIKMIMTKKDTFYISHGEEGAKDTRIY